MSSFARSLLRYSFLPAALIIFGKLLGIIITNMFLHYDYIVDLVPNGNFITKIFFYLPSQTYVATTISNATAIILFTIGLTMVTTRLLFLNDLNSHPKTIVRILQYNLTDFLSHAHAVYPQIMAWLMFTWLLVLVVLKDVYASMSPLYLGGFTLVLATGYSWLVLHNFDAHLQMLMQPRSRHHHG